MILFLWIILASAAFVVPYREQIAVGPLTEKLPPRSRRWIEGAAAILLATLPVTLDYINFLWRAQRWP